MKFIFSSLISLCLLTTHLFGQSSDRPQSIVIPISSIGEVSETRKQILQNTLTQELSKHFLILPQDQFERVQEKVFEELDFDECTEDQCIIRIQEVLQIENVFNLQVIGEEGDTQLNLKWMNLDEKKNREDYCEGCKTKELRKRVKVLVGQLMGVTESKPIVPIPSNKIVNPNKKINLTLYREKDREVWEREGKKWFRLGNDRTMIKYEGETSNGIPNGYGYMIFTNGDTFEGDFKNGEYVKGRYVFKSGSIYDGSFKDEKLNGVGDYKFSNGDSYIGNFKNGLKHGEGVYKWKNGNRFDGNWIEDIKEGKGKFTYIDGRKKIGEWKEDKKWFVKEYDKNEKLIQEWEEGLKINSKGILFRKYSNDHTNEWIWYKEGKLSISWKYEGEILNNQPNGKGILIHKNQKYVGYFKNGLFHGYGEYTYGNDGIYKGNWRKGFRHGEGEYLSSNGDRYIGKWRNNKPSFVKGYDKKGDLFYEERSKKDKLFFYVFNNDDLWFNEEKNNKGILRGSYFGEVKYDLPNGQGTYKSSYTYIGSWEMGLKNGIGKIIYPSGYIYEGNWYREFVYN